MSDGLRPDPSWEEWARALQRYQQANAIHQTAVSNEYLKSIQTVNDALRAGASISLRTAGHHLTCPPGEGSFHAGHSVSSFQEHGCLLMLHYVVVEFRQEGAERISRIALHFWDETHQQAVTWGAMTIQPQWESIVQQAGVAMERRTVDAERKRGEEPLTPDGPQPESRSAP